jgi:hypothetical protein
VDALALQHINLGADLGRLLNGMDSRYGKCGVSQVMNPELSPGESALYREIDFCKGVDSLELVPRSTESVIYYLGEVARRQLYSESLCSKPVPKRTVSIKYGHVSGNNSNVIPSSELCLTPKPIGKSHYHCEPLFVITQRSSPSSPSSRRGAAAVKEAPNRVSDSLIVSYDHKSFTTPLPANKDPMPGRTYQVLNMVTQLVGVNKSAKDLPTTSVFTLIGAP